MCVSYIRLLLFYFCFSIPVIKYRHVSQSVTGCMRHHPFSGPEPPRHKYKLIHVRIGDGNTSYGPVLFVGHPSARKHELLLPHDAFAYERFPKDFWLYVCDVGWDDTDARVLCRQFGYKSGKALCCSAFQGPKYDVFGASDIGCTGEEQMLQECRNATSISLWRTGVLECPSGHYGSVICFNQPPKDPTYKIKTTRRFEDGSIIGRVMLKYGDVWGRICPGNVSKRTAMVICKEQGYSTGIITRTLVQGTGPFLMNNISCNGNEMSLMHCKHAGWGELKGCDTTLRDVLVACFNDPQSFSVRLANGSSNGATAQGRVEVFIGGSWGTISMQIWSKHNANVLCRTLGYNGGKAFPNAYFGSGKEKIHINNVQCNGKESNFWHCGIQFHSAENSSHSQDVGVSCYTNVKLDGQYNSREGAVMVFHNNSWFPLSDSDFDDNVTSLVCQELGYPYGLHVCCNGFGRHYSRYLRLSGKCDTTNKTSIVECMKHKTRAGPAAGVVCLKKAFDNSSFSVTLAGGGSFWGRLVVSVGGVRGRICPVEWNDNAASAACRSLNFKGGVAYQLKRKTSKVFVMGRVKCHNNAVSLVNCSYIPLNGDMGCTSNSLDAGVLCYQSSGIQFRLVGNNRNSGRVEINYDGNWGTVCRGSWLNEDAAVFCRQLGYTTGKWYHPSQSNKAAYYLPVYLGRGACTGKENTILMCPNSGWKMGINSSCNTHSRDAAAVCYGAVRLHKGISATNGRVEVLWNNKWAVVSDNNWNKTSAVVACRQLGFSSGFALCCAAYGPQYKVCPIVNIRCKGNEQTVLDCDIGLLRAPENQSGRTDYASVHCYNGIKSRESTFSIKGRPGNVGTFTGIVIVHFAGVKGVICPDGWDDNDAKVACSMLGYQTGQAYYQYKTGSASSDFRYLFWTSQVNCSGDEDHLSKCPMVPFGDVRHCSIKHMAAVLCTNTEGVLYKLSGKRPNAGRLNVQVNGIWGTMCPHWSWSDTDARVLCRQMGYSDGIAGKPIFRQFGKGTGPIWQINPRCEGNETAFRYCPIAGWHQSNPRSCKDHKNDVGIVCYGTGTFYKIKTIAKFSKGSIIGRVMVKYAGRWGRICPRNVSKRTAEVICREHGFKTGIIMRTHDRGSGPFLMNNISCNGNEASLMQCKHAGWGEPSGCNTSSTDALVACFNDPRSFSIRLANGSSHGPVAHGRVEVFIGGRWRAISKPTWNRQDAISLCRTLGYNGGNGFSHSYFGRGKGKIYIADVQCNGTELNFWQCGIRFLSSGMTTHKADVGVYCYTNVKLDAYKTMQGNINVFHKNRWFPLCDQNFDHNVAGLVCQELGYTNGLHICCNGFRRHYSRYLRLTEKCDTTHKASIAECMKEEANCSTAAGVVCSKNVIHNNVISVTLGGRDSFWGRLEVNVGGVSGRICSVDWNDAAASAACRDLNFKGGVAYHSQLHPYQRTKKLFVMGRVKCPRSASSLANCTYVTLGEDTGCSSNSNAAGVLCYQSSGIQFRLGGNNKKSGRMEISYDGKWGTVCHNNNWSHGAAAMFCRHLGFATGKMRLPSKSSRAPSHWPAYLNSIHCTGNENNFFMCENPGWNKKIHPMCRNHLKDAGAVCYDTVRLHRGVSATHGRVEVIRNNKWTVVCDSNWDDHDAGVVCRKLGFTAGFPLCCGAYGPQYSLSASMNNARCKSNEQSLLDCSVSQLGAHEQRCRVENYASVHCYNGSKPTAYSISVEGEASSVGTFAGIVTVRFAGVKGVICADSWDDNDARVACRQLGFHTGQAYYEYKAPSPYNSFRYLYWTSQVSCNGREDHLSKCTMVPMGGVRHCQRKHTAAVLCTQTKGVLYGLVGKKPNVGRVEVNINGVWGTMCLLGQWDEREARVICRQMGYPDGIVTKTVIGQSGRGTGPIWQIDPHCDGNESSLQSCPIAGWRQATSHLCRDHRNDVSVVCHATVRINTVGSNNRSHGPVEIFQSGRWYAVCDWNFNYATARLVCQELGFRTGFPICCAAKRKKDLSLKVNKYSLSCTGMENSIKFCMMKSECRHKDYASVICKK